MQITHWLLLSSKPQPASSKGRLAHHNTKHDIAVPFMEVFAVTSRTLNTYTLEVAPYPCQGPEMYPFSSVHCGAFPQNPEV